MENSEISKRVLVCQNRTCRKQGSAKVLAAFQSLADAEVEVVASGCLGHCGSGPMVLVLPEKVWYSRVCAGEVGAIEQHLQGGKPVESLLYKKRRKQS
ncbi:MAG: (2Fe-2S) ferredoxin domain-containing protein [Richelia sp. CSU_2_1]|nr:(2Fe-2S) ferredoxin domain-containing protein [Microcoleus sp. SU_5_6]NJR23803.1 (2Fe-2S) ferredoxin domain-containing protein [Richelia sp. CSU_2_1]